MLKTHAFYRNLTLLTALTCTLATSGVSIAQNISSNTTPVFQNPTNENAFELGAPFAHHMVLQRNQKVPIWGKATPHATVTLSFHDQKHTTQASAKGDWKIILHPMKASSIGTTLTITSNDKTISIEDVVVGDVWICAGQSNMEYGVTETDANNVIKECTDSLLRLSYIHKRATPFPETTINGGLWALCTPETIKKGSRGQGFSATAYCFGRELRKDLNVPIGLIQAAWSGAKIEGFIPTEAYAKEPQLKKTSDWISKVRQDYRSNVTRNLEAYKTFCKSAELALQNQTELPPPPPSMQIPIHDRDHPTALYNAMIHPWVPYAICGAIWYQGESNRGDGMLYFNKKHALISGWRTAWGQGDFPFYFVAIAPYNYRNNPQQLPEIWEAQVASAEKIPHVGMAVVSDATNLKDIHPRDKFTVGKRLARLALSNQFGVEMLDSTGPIFKSMEVKNNAIYITFDYARSGLTSSDGKPLNWFEIAGFDGKFVKADARIENNQVIVSSAEVASPMDVRFAWDHMAVPNLMNKDGIPATAFRTSNRVNLALGASYVTTDTNQFNWGAAGQLTDGKWSEDKNSCFATNNTPQFPKMVTVDLKATHPIQLIRFGVPAFGSTKTVSVSVSDDGKDFKTVGQHLFSQEKTEIANIPLKDTTARYIRLTYLDFHSKRVQYEPTFCFTTELEVY